LYVTKASRNVLAIYEEWKEWCSFGKNHWCDSEQLWGPSRECTTIDLFKVKLAAVVVVPLHLWMFKSRNTPGGHLLKTIRNVNRLAACQRALSGHFWNCYLCHLNQIGHHFATVATCRQKNSFCFRISE